MISRDKYVNELINSMWDGNIGLYITKDKKKINAAVSAAFNIIRK